MTVDNNQRAARQVDFERARTFASASPSAASSSRPSRPSRPSQPPAYDRIPDAPHYSDFLRNLGRTPELLRSEASASERVALAKERAIDAEVRMRLDGFRDRFSGPYVVDGKPVRARPMFRMNTGFNDANMRAHQPELFAICRRAGCGDAVGPVCYGRPTPEQLVRVTQALLDAGKLPPGPDEACQLRIRQMQWAWGIGVDCAGYTEGASAAARGKTVQPSMGDAFSGLAHNPTRRKVDVAEIRPGDVIHLDPPQRNDVGHNVVVYDNAVIDEARRAELAARDPAAAAFLSAPGPFRAITVDSSWGAGEGNDYGGFRRDRWIYDEGTRRWGFFDHGSGPFGVSARGPHDEPYAGAFRPKD
jgi:hypothetical protein